MATTEILAIGSSNLRSSEVTVASGGSATLSLKVSSASLASPMNTAIEALIQIKSADSVWFTIGYLRGTPSESAKTISGPGVYSVYRLSPVDSYGVDSST